MVPLRPTRKSEFPLVHMDQYVRSTLSRGPPRPLPSLVSKNITSSILCSTDNKLGQCELPFDPWMRKHVRLGGILVKIAPCSQFVSGTFEEWQNWTGIDFGHFLRTCHELDLMINSIHEREYMEVPIPGALVSLRVHVQKRECTYAEPNVWVYHRIEQSQCSILS